MCMLIRFLYMDKYDKKADCDDSFDDCGGRDRAINLQIHVTFKNSFDDKKINLTSDRTVTIMRLPLGHLLVCIRITDIVGVK